MLEPGFAALFFTGGGDGTAGTGSVDAGLFGPGVFPWWIRCEIHAWFFLREQDTGRERSNRGPVGSNGGEKCGYVAGKERLTDSFQNRPIGCERSPREREKRRENYAGRLSVWESISLILARTSVRMRSAGSDLPGGKRTTVAEKS